MKYSVVVTKDKYLTLKINHDMHFMVVYDKTHMQTVAVWTVEGLRLCVCGYLNRYMRVATLCFSALCIVVGVSRRRPDY